MDLTRASFLVAVTVEVAGTNPRRPLLPHYPGPRALRPTRKTLAAIEQASLVVVDDLAADTALTPRLIRSLTSMDTTRCLT